jgi:hypothetical protein
MLLISPIIAKSALESIPIWRFSFYCWLLLISLTLVLKNVRPPNPSSIAWIGNIDQGQQLRLVQQ